MSGLKVIFLLNRKIFKVSTLVGGGEFSLIISLGSSSIIVLATIFAA